MTGSILLCPPSSLACRAGRRTGHGGWQGGLQSSVQAGHQAAEGQGLPLQVHQLAGQLGAARQHPALEQARPELCLPPHDLHMPGLRTGGLVTGLPSCSHERLLGLLGLLADETLLDVRFLQHDGHHQCCS